MAKTANLNIRIDPEIKENAEKLYKNFGITVSDAVNIFLHKSLMVGGLPFDMKLSFNAETEAAMQEAALIASGKLSAKGYTSARALIGSMICEDRHGNVVFIGYGEQNKARFASLRGTYGYYRGDEQYQLFDSFYVFLCDRPG